MSTSAERMRRLRERRSALLEPGPGAPPGDDDGTLTDAVEATIAALELGERDAGTAALARMYALAIDRAADRGMALKVFGPQLRRVLESMGATPMSRSRLPKREPQRQGPNAIAKLRASHARSKARYGREA